MKTLALNHANKTCGSAASAPVCYPLILFPFLPITISICCLTLSISRKLDNKGLASHIQGIRDRQKKNSKMHGTRLSKCILLTWSCQMCAPFDYSVQQLLILSAGPLSLTYKGRTASCFLIWSDYMPCHSRGCKQSFMQLKKKHHTKTVPLSHPGLISDHT